MQLLLSDAFPLFFLLFNAVFLFVQKFSYLFKSPSGIDVM